MKNKFKFLFLLILVSFLVLFFVERSQEELKDEKNNFLETKTEKVLKNFEGIFISKEKIEPGEVLFVKIKANQGLPEYLTFLSQKVNFSKFNENWISFIGIRIQETPGKYPLKIFFKEGKVFEKEIEILKKEFPVREMVVSEELKEKGYEAEKITKEIQEKESKKINEICNIFTENLYFQEPFIFPLEKIRVVGDFGVLRKSGESSFWHFGVDLEAKERTPVYATNKGKIVLAEEFKNFGKTIIIDHGGGIFSLYLHLSEFKAKEGDFVERKQIIALSGNTGYSLEPHLHFSIRVNGISVEPLKFIETLNEKLFFKKETIQNLKDEIASKFKNKIPKEWGEKVSGVKTKIDTKENLIALTFDACGGPGGSGYDEKLIKFLTENSIPATLFLSGLWIDENLEIAKKLSENPLFEIENHGLLHRPCSVFGKIAYDSQGTKNVEEIIEEIELNAQKIEQISKRKPKFYRPGTAFLDEICVEIAEELGESVVGFSVIGDGGARFSKEEVKKTLLNAPAGSIIIFHMNHPESETAEGIIEALPELKKMGFEFVKLSGFPLK